MIVPATLVIIHLVIYVRPGAPSSSHFTLHHHMLFIMLLTESDVDSSSFYVGFREVIHSGCNAVMLVPVTLVTNSSIAHRCYSQCDQSHIKLCECASATLIAEALWSGVGASSLGINKLW